MRGKSDGAVSIVNTMGLTPLLFPIAFPMNTARGVRTGRESRTGRRRKGGYVRRGRPG